MEVFEMFVKEVAEKVAEAAGAADAAGAAGGSVRDGWDYEKCEALYRAAAAESEKIGLPVCFAIADKSGALVYFYRQPGALLASIAIAINKAYTSAVLRMTTGDLAKAAGPGGELYGINTVDPKLVIFGGGFPIYSGGKLVCAIGISGGTIAQDEQIGRAVLAALGN